MDVVSRECRFVTGRSVEHGGAGDSAVLTAFGVFQGMRAAARHRWGTASLAGRRVGVLGVGKVGRHLVDHLVEDGAEVMIADVTPPRSQPYARHTPVCRSVRRQISPGGSTRRLRALRPGWHAERRHVGGLSGRVVCGGANNQLAHPGTEKLLADRGILYAPDYVVNAGGLIQVADEIDGFSEPTGPRQGGRRSSRRRPGCSSSPMRRECPRRWRRTGSPRSGWPGSAACVGSSCRPAPPVDLPEWRAYRATALPIGSFCRFRGRTACRIAQRACRFEAD